MPRPRRKPLLLVTALLVVIAVVVFGRNTQREPIFEGRSLGEWCDQGLAANGADDEQPFLQASNAVWEIGEKAVPWLVRWGTVNQPKWESWLDETAGTKFMALGKWVETRDKARDRDRERAEFLADTLRERAGSAIPELFKPREPGDLDVFMASVDLIERIGPRGLPHLAFAVTNVSADHRSVALLILCAWGPEAESAGTMIWPQFDPKDDSLEQEDILNTLAVIRHRPGETVAAIAGRIQRFPNDEEHCSELYYALHETGLLGVPEFAHGLVSINSVQREASTRVLVTAVGLRRAANSESENPERLIYAVELDAFTRSALAQGGREAKTNCLKLVRELLDDSGDGRRAKHYAASKATCFLGELALDPDPVVSDTAKALVAEFGPLSRIQRGR